MARKPNLNMYANIKKFLSISINEIHNQDMYLNMSQISSNLFYSLLLHFNLSNLLIFIGVFDFLHFLYYLNCARQVFIISLVELLSDFKYQLIIFLIFYIIVTSSQILKFYDVHLELFGFVLTYFLCNDRLLSREFLSSQNHLDGQIYFACYNPIDVFLSKR